MDVKWIISHNIGLHTVCYIRDAHISGHLTKYFSKELNQQKELPNNWSSLIIDLDQTETESIRNDIETPNANNAESPVDIGCYSKFFIFIMVFILIGILIGIKSIYNTMDYYFQ